MPIPITKTPKKLPYAKGTTISSSESLEQIKTTLRKFGATGFAQAEDETAIQLLFILGGGSASERRVRFSMPLPPVSDFMVKKGGAVADTPRTPAQAVEAFRLESNRKWRALAAGIKAKLVLVEEGIESIEEAFYANIVLPNGATIYEETRAAVAHAYERGLMPKTLLALPPKEEK